MESGARGATIRRGSSATPRPEATRAVMKSLCPLRAASRGAKPRAAQARWGVPVAVQMAAIHQESKFIGDARTPHQYALGIIPIGRQSSAFGYSQALDGTWEEYLADTGKRRARRDDIRDATDFMGWYMDGTARRLGISKGDAASQYLAYHEGRTGFAAGSHLAKPWLMGVAGKVQQRAEMYQLQLASCGRA